MIALNRADLQHEPDMGLIYIKPESIIAVERDGDRGTIVRYGANHWVVVTQEIEAIIVRLIGE